MSAAATLYDVHESKPVVIFFSNSFPLTYPQGRLVTVSECFLENISYALELVRMPLSEKDVSKFFAGVPPSPEQQGGEGEEGEQGEEGEKGEEGRGEGEGGRLHPPKAKRSKSEGKALNVLSLHVSGLYSTCRLSLHVLITSIFSRNTESSLAMPGLPI